MIERFEMIGDHNWATCSADHVARYLFASNYVKDKKVLDVGTGIGYGAAMLKAYGAASVHAIDIDVETVTKANSLFSSSGITFQVHDSEQLDKLPEKYDIVVSFENIEHLSQPMQFIATSKRILNPGGRLICSSPSRETTSPFVDGKPSNPYHINEWFRGEFARLFAPHYDNIQEYSQIRSYSLIEKEKGLTALLSLLGNPIRSPIHHLLIRGVTRFADLAHLGKSIRRAFSLAQDISGIASPSIQEFPIVPADVALLFGQLYGHLVVTH